jgi:hypothetical protein
MTHTPGPWAYDQESDNSTDFWVFQANGPARIAVEVSERDAALIAAAPDLLAALQEVTRCLAWHAQEHPVGMDCVAVAKARAAITRATGA